MIYRVNFARRSFIAFKYTNWGKGRDRTVKIFPLTTYLITVFFFVKDLGTIELLGV